jgi:hypothetical protein
MNLMPGHSHHLVVSFVTYIHSDIGVLTTAERPTRVADSTATFDYRAFFSKRASWVLTPRSPRSWSNGNRVMVWTGRGGDPNIYNNEWSWERERVGNVVNEIQCWVQEFNYMYLYELKSRTISNSRRRFSSRGEFLNREIPQGLMT